MKLLTVLLIATLLSFHCEARAYKKKQNSQDAESTTSTTQSPLGEDTQEEDSVETNRPSRSRPLRQPSPICADMSSVPEKRVDNGEPKASAMEEQKSSVQPVEKVDDDGKQERKKKSNKNRRTQTPKPTPEPEEVEEKPIKAEPAIPIEASGAAPAIPSLEPDTVDEPDRKKIRRGDQKRKPKRGSSRTTTTSTTTTLAPESFSEETNEDDLDNSNLFPKQNDEEAGPEGKKNGRSGEKPSSTKALAASPATIRALAKGSDEGDDTVSDIQRVPTERDLLNRPYQGRQDMHGADSQVIRRHPRRHPVY